MSAELRSIIKAPTEWAGLELRHLIALDAIAEQRSFGRAGLHIGYSQSAVSQQIATLEGIVGEQLIERLGGPRPVQMTEAGTLLLEHARQVFAGLSAARDDLAAIRDGSGASLRVGAFQSVGAAILPALLARLTRTPRLRVEFTQTTSDGELVAALESGDLDITFAILPLPEGPFAVQEVVADRWVVAVAGDSPLARRGAPVALETLADMPLVTGRSCRCFRGVEAQLREQGIRPDIVHRSDENATVRGLVARGAGIALVPALSAGPSDEAVRVLELEVPLPPRRIVRCWRSDRRAVAAHERFGAEVAATCRELGLAPDIPARSSRVLPLRPEPGRRASR